MRIIRFIIKYYLLVFNVIWLTFRYNVVYLLSGNKQLLDYIMKLNGLCSNPNSTNSEYIVLNYARKIDKLMDFIPLPTTCLIRSMVKQSILRKKGIKVMINLGFLKTPDSCLFPHACISYSNNNKSFANLLKINT